MRLLRYLAVAIALLIAAPVNVILIAPPAIAGTHGIPISGVIDVFATLPTAVQNQVRTWQPNDVTTYITAAIASCPNTACVLDFAPGRYMSPTCNFTLSAPTTVSGGGESDYEADAGVSQIECSNGSASLFTVTAKWAQFENISLVDTAGSRTGGSAILVNGSYVSTKVDYEGLYVSGFYDSIDIRAGESWVMHNFRLIGCVHWCIRVQNTVNVDAGDWSISQGNIYPASSASAGLEYESSGGGKIANTKIEANSGTITNGIRMDTTGHVSIQFLIDQVDIEGVSGPAINLVRAWQGVVVTGSFLKVPTATAAISVTACPQCAFVGNTMISGGTGTYAVDMVSSDSFSTVDANNYYGFNYPSQGCSTCNVDYSGFAFSVAGVALPSASNLLAGTRAFVTDANSTTGHAAYTGSSTNAVGVISDGSAWHIGY